MYTLDTDDRRACIHQAAGNGGGAAFTALFGAIYEVYSHSVYSYYMIYAFAPLLVISLMYLCFALFAKHPPRRVTRNLLSAYGACSAVGMTAKGVVVIFGSTNRLLIGYLIISSILLILTMISFFRDTRIGK